MELLIVTGMSGAGKSQAANALEDMGYYCVDNIPPAIIPSFVELSTRGGSQLERVALVTDVRGGNLFHEINDILDTLTKNGVLYKILFLDASNEVLIRRYRENRRKHPLCTSGNLSVSAAVLAEREMLNRLRLQADYVVDTSHISLAQLHMQLSDIFFGNINNGFRIQCLSFGFKYGSETQADLVFDVRCLPNPFYVESLKPKTGIDIEVQNYVLDSDECIEFRDKLFSFLECAVKLYAKEGKSQLIIGFGCTGGKHRSVTFAEITGEYLKKIGYDVIITHRDIYKS